MIIRWCWFDFVPFLLSNNICVGNSFPFLYQMYGGLFNFVIEYTFMFTPSFFTACKSDKYRWSLDVLQGSKCSLPTILCSCCPFSPLFSCCLRHNTFYRYFHYHSSLVDFTCFYWVCFQQLHQIWKKLLYIILIHPRVL
jgi:hypothetical protein